MTYANDCGCPEYHALSRRGFLTRTGVAAAAASVPAWLPQVAYAQSASTSRDVLVTLFLRGGVDGMTMCVPHAEAAYYAARPSLAVPRPDSTSADRATDLDGFFGFPPSMAPLLPAYRAGHLLVAHATGSTDPTRSHFDAQRFMEVGTPSDPSLDTGWVGRHLVQTPPMRAGALLRGLTLGSATAQIQAGGPATVPVMDPAHPGLAGITQTTAARTAWLARTYQTTIDPLQTSAANALSTMSLLERVNVNGYTPLGGATYGQDVLGRGLRATAALVRADVGVESVHLDVPGWDTHQNQGSTQGTLANLLTSLAGGLSAFYADVIAGAGARVTVVVLSEFGRMLRENANRGLDHGHGTAMLLLGTGISGGRVLARWPGLQPENLDRGEALAVTLDYRDVLAEVVQRRLGDGGLGAVFPGYAASFVGVTR